MSDSITVFLLTREGLGQSDPALQAKLLHNFMGALVEKINSESAAPFTLVFYTEAVKLLVADSPVLVELRTLEMRGVPLLACGTCVDFYNLRERLAVGRISNMAEIVTTFTHAARVITV